MAKVSKRMITVYSLGMFGTTTGHGVYQGERDSGKLKVISFVPPGKRKALTCGSDSMVVFEGEFPEGQDGFVKDGSGNSKSRYGSYDIRYKEEHNVFVDELIRKHPDKVLIDNRGK